MLVSWGYIGVAGCRVEGYTGLMLGRMENHLPAGGKQSGGLSQMGLLRTLFSCSRFAFGVSGAS